MALLSSTDVLDHSERLRSAAPVLASLGVLVGALLIGTFLVRDLVQFGWSLITGG